jgi:tRNA(His) guanylyltransferase
VLSYQQSDEVSVLVHGYRRHASEAWFDNAVQKMVSVAASRATAAMASAAALYWQDKSLALFDARAFVLPEADVCNYFVWRQQDATRNSIQMAARAVFSHRECDRKNTSQLQDMLHAKGINWNDYPTSFRRGRCMVRRADAFSAPELRWLWRVDNEVPIFSQDRAYIEQYLAVEAES